MPDSLRTTTHLRVLDRHPLFQFLRKRRLDEAPELVLSRAEEILGPHMSIFPVHSCDGFAGQVEVYILSIDAFKDGAPPAPQLLSG